MSNLIYFNEFLRLRPSVKVFVAAAGLSEYDMMLTITFRDSASDHRLTRMVPEKKVGSTTEFISILNEMLLEWLKKDKFGGWE